jgi:hypothetical protein
LLAKVANDDAGLLTPRGVLKFFASKLAPTHVASASVKLWQHVIVGAMPDDCHSSNGR